MAKSGNRGEWSEIYALFRLLADGVVYAGDGDMRRMDGLFYPILNVIRKEDSLYEYKPSGDEVIIYKDSSEIMRVPRARFSEMADKLLILIRSSKGAAFKLPEMEAFMESISCHALKARAQDKTDIRIVVHDFRTGMDPEQGFSIKSQLGKASTLLNPGKTTNFLYEVTGPGPMDEDTVSELNGIEGQTERMERLFSMGYTLKYRGMDCETFEDNLTVIDSMMPEIVAECILEHYLTGHNHLKEIISSLASRNPLGVRKAPIFYVAKIKALLIDAALGMTPAKVWKGRYDANGGYIVVKRDGEVLCYHFHDRNQLEDYLLNNTRLDYPSRSRYEYGKIFKSPEGRDLIKLNLQIRFK